MSKGGSAAGDGAAAATAGHGRRCAATSAGSERLTGVDARRHKLHIDCVAAAHHLPCSSIRRVRSALAFRVRSCVLASTWFRMPRPTKV